MISSVKLVRQVTGLGDINPGSPIASSSGASALFLSNNASIGGNFECVVGGTTHSGIVGKQNQDAFFLWESNDRNTIISAVFDGHGRELGQLAANIAREVMLDALTTPEALRLMRTSPKTFLEEVFSRAHKAIEHTFAKFYEDEGWIVEPSMNGYLVRFRSTNQSPICIHGGTTATVVIVLDKHKVIIANVGDSTAIAVGVSSVGAVDSIDSWIERDVPATVEKNQQSSRSSSPSQPSFETPKSQNSPVPSKARNSFLELSADHSPENHHEFSRICAIRPHPTSPNTPELQFVYDTLSNTKLQCPPIFHMNVSSNSYRKSDRGCYYKNVRGEWATLVATPRTAAYQDALAFTRSLGDLHLQSYGVSHEPEICWMDLTKCSQDSSSSHPIAIVLSTDGIWDNWKYEEVSNFVLDDSEVSNAYSSKSALHAAEALMNANLERARINFGNSADNMTTIVLYFFPIQ
jgi:serine/threonine protein phosphatase PrpC